MSEIKFYMPHGHKIPVEFILYVDDVFVKYKRIKDGFRFYVLLKNEAKAMEVVEEIIDRIKWENEEPQYGITWCTVSLEIVPQDERYKINTIIDWVYRVRDSY